MPRVATCTNCHQRVVVPEGLEPREVVRCPWCSDEFPLAEVLPSASEQSTDAEDDPPAELVPIARDGSEAPESQSSESESGETDKRVEPTPERPTAGPEESAESAEPDRQDAEVPDGAVEPAESAPEVVRVRCPCCAEEYPLSEALVAATGEPLGPAAAAAVADGTVRSEGVEAASPWAAIHAAPHIDTGVEAGAASGAFDFARGDADEGTRPGGIASRRLRGGPEKSMFRALGGWVFGGVGGLVIGYYLINAMLGERGDILKVPLPGIRHTYKHSPGWFPRWLQAADDSAATGDGADVDEADAWLSEADGGDLPTPAASETVMSLSEAPKTAKKERSFPADYVGLAEPPDYLPEDLANSLQAARRSVTSGIDPRTYESLCRLAEVVTFIDPGARQSGEGRSAAGALIAEIGQDPANLDKIGYQAGALCAAGNRKGNGIVLAGKIVDHAAEGKAHATQVELAASGRTVLVAGNDPLPAQPGDAVLILGSIVDDPAKNLIGFDTQKPYVIWAGLTVKVE